MPIFPDTLPPLTAVDQFAASLADNLIRFQPSVGPATVRRRSTNAPRPLSMGHRAFTTAQMRELRSFFEDTTQHGSLTFHMEDPVSGTLEKMRFATPPQFLATTWDRWQVTCQLEVLP